MSQSSYHWGAKGDMSDFNIPMDLCVIDSYCQSCEISLIYVSHVNKVFIKDGKILFSFTVSTRGFCKE